VRNYIIFNDFDTSKYALIEELPIVDRPEEDIEFIEIEGRHGYLTFKKGRYKPIEYTVDLVFKGKENRDIIKSKFQGNGNLILSNEPDRFYGAVVTGVITFERQTRDVYICTISFKLQPFAYEINEDEVSPFSQPYTLTNHTNTTAQPIIEIYGSGSGVLSINNTDIQIREIGECIILDFELQEAYGKDGSSKNTQVLTDYEELVVGKNVISWSGNITDINIFPRWRWL
jgi:predicted phage tail component-like protein